MVRIFILVTASAFVLLTALGILRTGGSASPNVPESIRLEGPSGLESIRIAPAMPSMVPTTPAETPAIEVLPGLSRPVPRTEEPAPATPPARDSRDDGDEDGELDGLDEVDDVDEDELEDDARDDEGG